MGFEILLMGPCFSVLHLLSPNSHLLHMSHLKLLINPEVISHLNRPMFTRFLEEDTPLKQGVNERRVPGKIAGAHEPAARARRFLNCPHNRSWNSDFGFIGDETCSVPLLARRAYEGREGGMLNVREQDE